MLLNQVHHSLQLHRTFDTPIKKFDLSIWLHSFARSLISIFIPILFLRAGYSIAEVMIYYFIYNVIDVPLNFFASWLTRKIGARWVIILGSMFMLAYFLSLSALHYHSWMLLIMIAFLAAIYDAFYWVAHLFFFVKCSTHKDNISKDTSTLSILRQVASLVAPALGAAVLIFFNENILIYISVSVIALSTIPLFSIQKISDKPIQPKKSFKEFFHSFDITKDYISTMFFGIHMATESIIFPIFIFVLLGNVTSVAAVPILAAVAAIIFTYMTGNVKKEHRLRTMMIGALVAGIFWILRIIFNDDMFLYFSIFVVGIFSVMISVPLVSTVFEKGERINTLDASAYRNAASMFGKMILFGLLAALVAIFKVSFITASLSLFLFILINYIYQQKQIKQVSN